MTKGPSKFTSRTALFVPGPIPWSCFYHIYCTPVPILCVNPSNALACQMDWGVGHTASVRKGRSQEGLQENVGTGSILCILYILWVLKESGGKMVFRDWDCSAGFLCNL